MDASALFSEFMASEHGAGAADALAGLGIDPGQASQMLAHATEAAHAHVESQGAGLMGSHPGKSFFAAFASGLVRGDGFFKSLTEGGEGIITGRVAEALAARAGVDSSTASTIAAAATPYLMAFLRNKLG